MKTTKKFVHGISENKQLTVKIVEEIIDNGKVLGGKHSIPMSPQNTEDMSGWDEKSQEIVEAIKDIQPEATVIDENGIRKIITYECRKIGDQVNVREIIRYVDIATDMLIGRTYTNTQSYDPGHIPILCDPISKKFIELMHTPEVVAEYKAKLAEQATI